MEECTQTYDCVDAGKECNYTADNCDEDSQDCCPFDYYCLEEECAESSEGLECNTTADCYAEKRGTQLALCVDGECRLASNAGDECDDDDHPCYYTNMTCSSKSVCTGFALGASCEQPEVTDDVLPWRSVGVSCAEGLYCNSSSLCAKMLKEGAACNGTVPCGMNLICENNTCVELFSRAAGQACSSDYVCEADCLCVDGNCTEYDKPELTECDTDADCTTSCNCSLWTGNSYCDIDMDTVCRSEEKDMYSCFAENNCAAGYFSLDSSSCQNVECGEEVSDYYSCILCDYLKTPYSPCIAQDDKEKYCPSLETWEKLVILAVIVAVVIVIIVVITICCCCSKQKGGDYQEVKG